MTFPQTKQSIMPAFVPVVDSEKPRSEQVKDETWQKHRQFDTPYIVKPKDRGWQQGSLGWGVLGEFGSNEKDSAAQVIKRAEGMNKMVKNEINDEFFCEFLIATKLKNTMTSRVRADIQILNLNFDRYEHTEIINGI